MFLSTDVLDTKLYIAFIVATISVFLILEHTLLTYPFQMTLGGT